MVDAVFVALAVFYFSFSFFFSMFDVWREINLMLKLPCYTIYIYMCVCVCEYKSKLSFGGRKKKFKQKCAQFSTSCWGCA